MKRFFFYIVIIVAGFNQGCFKKIIADYDNNFDKNVDGWRPSDFDPKEGILLIEKVKTKKWQSRTEKFMTEIYPYKYEFFEEGGSVDKNEKYKDKKVYRFVLAQYYQTKWASAPRQSLADIKRQGMEMRSGPVAVASYDYHFVDRLNDKTYPNSGKSASDASIPVKAILGNILKIEKYWKRY